MGKKGVGFDVVLGLIILVVVLLLVIFFVVPNWGTLTEKWKDVQDKLIVKTDESGNILKSAFKRLSPEGKKELLEKYSDIIEKGCKSCDKDRIEKLWSVYDAVEKGEISDEAIRAAGHTKNEVKSKLINCISYCDDVSQLNYLMKLDPKCEDSSYYRTIISNIKDKLTTNYGENEFNDFVKKLLEIKGTKECSGLNDYINNLIGKDVTSLSKVKEDSELGKIRQNKIQLGKEGWYLSFEEGVRYFNQEKYNEAKQRFEFVKTFTEINNELINMFNDYKVYSEFFIARISVLQDKKCEELKGSSSFNNYVDIANKKIKDQKKIPDKYYGGKNSISKYIGVQLLYDLAECKGEGVEQFEYYDILLRLKGYDIETGAITKMKGKLFEHCYGSKDFSSLNNKDLKDVNLYDCRKKDEIFGNNKGLFRCLFLDDHTDVGDNDGTCVPCVAVQTEDYNCELYGKPKIGGNKWFDFDLFGKEENVGLVRDYCSNDICDFNVGGGCEVYGDDKKYCTESGVREIKIEPGKPTGPIPTGERILCGACDDSESEGGTICTPDECLTLRSKEEYYCLYLGGRGGDDCISCLSDIEKSCEDYNYIGGSVEGGVEFAGYQKWAEEACNSDMCKVGGCQWHSDRRRAFLSPYNGLCLPKALLNLNTIGTDFGQGNEVEINMKPSKSLELGNKYGRYYFIADGGTHVIEFEKYKENQVETSYKGGYINEIKFTEINLLFDFWTLYENQALVRSISTLRLYKNKANEYITICLPSLDKKGYSSIGIQIRLISFSPSTETLTFNLKKASFGSCTASVTKESTEEKEDQNILDRSWQALRSWWWAE